MNYYTSDLHLGHAAIIKLCNRPFATVEEMDRNLIDSWNARVHRNDHIYIVGDLVYKSEEHASHYLDKLKGKKHLIMGNHDRKWIKNIELEKYFD